MRSNSLHARFRIAVLLIAATLSALVAVVVYQSAKSHYMQTGEASARAIVAAVQRTVAVGVYARDQVLLDELVDGLARHPSVSRVGVRDVSGVMMASKYAKDPLSYFSQTGQENLPASFISPLASPFNPEEITGHLEVWLDEDRLESEARRQASMVVGAQIVLLAGVLLVFNALASRLLSRPMHRLAGELALIRPGSETRLPVEWQHAHDEVGVVTDAANRLLDLQQAALERERSMRGEITALEARYRGIFDSTSAGIFILSVTGELLQGNPALSQLLGLSTDVARASNIVDFAASVFLRPKQFSHLVETARTSAQPEAADLEMTRNDRSQLWVHCMVSYSTDPMTGEDRVEGVLYDITKRKQQEDLALHRAEHDTLTGLKSRAYIESTLGQHIYSARRNKGSVTLMFIDLDGFKAVNDTWGHAAGDAVLVQVSQRLRGLFQRNCDLVGRLGGDELVVMITGFEATHPSVGDLATRLIESFKLPFVLPNREFTYVGASVGVASYPMHAVSSKTLLQAADAAMYAVKQSGKGAFVIAQTGVVWPDAGMTTWEDSLEALDMTARTLSDPLTGLLDRRQLIERLATAHAGLLDEDDAMAVICLDIDQFKLLNVSHGSPIGDEVLCEAARRLTAVLRSGDTIARTGSDEFVAVVPAQGQSSDELRRMAQGVARKLLASLADVPMKLSTCTVTIHASAGVSLMDLTSADGMDVLREAQLALRRSKAVARNGTTFFENDMMAGLRNQIALEEDLRLAIGTEQMFLHVQPQVNRAGIVTGGEALLRWKHPTRGVVPPDQFIPLAESCGAIIALGDWVLRAGCEILVRMRQEGGTQTLAVNISPLQFNHPDFVSHIREALLASGAPAEGLILEITEGVLITDFGRVSERLRELVAMGLRFSIDDFGTGFSSLGYLRQLPLYEIKIDRSFIVGLPEEVAGAGIVRSILSMGSHLGLHVVAEGVETQTQADFLSDNGCPSQQGWLHGRPMSPDDFMRCI